MSMSSAHSQEPISQIRRQSISSTTSDDDEEDFIDDGDSNDRSSEKNTKNLHSHKKTLGRVKIKMAYIDNKIRRYTTFSKRKTGIMKKAYELATLTGTEVMLLVASETGHVYTYATAKLQPMITSEAGKALIRTCLAKDEPIVDIPTATTTLNDNDVILIDENQRQKRTNATLDAPSVHSSTGNRPIKRAKLKSIDDVSSPSTNKPKSNDPSTSHVFSPTTTTIKLPLPCLIHSDPPQQLHTAIPSSYTIDLNTFKHNGMNIIFAPSTSTSSAPSSPSNSPLVLTLGHFPYQPS